MSATPTETKRKKKGIESPVARIAAGGCEPPTVGTGGLSSGPLRGQYIFFTSKSSFQPLITTLLLIDTDGLFPILHNYG